MYWLNHRKIKNENRMYCFIKLNDSLSIAINIFNAFFISLSTYITEYKPSRHLKMY